MPEAIATTKRKFYKALDSLNNPPATRPTEPAAKRARRSVSMTSTVSRTTVTTTAPKTGDATPKQPPNYSPWSHETFLARLKTFSSVSLWHPKPEAISEVEWAKKGWMCVDVNTVACKGGCGKRVVVSMDFEKRTSTEAQDDEFNATDGVDDAEADGETESMLEEGLVKRYRSLIVDGHSDTCMWHKAGCKDDIYHLPVVRPSIWQSELRKRYQSLQSIDGAIRDVNIIALPHETTSSLPPERLMVDLPAELLSEDDSSPKHGTKALEVALHGWRGSHDSGNDLLHCDACFQRVGLWMYQPGYQQSRTCSDNEDEEAATINLLELHRDYCPWRNPDTQKASGSLSGLNASQILQRVVSTYAREQRRKSGEQQKTPQQLETEDEDGEGTAEAPVSSAPSREEVARQDKERESRLRKLKSLFTIKRRATVKPAVAAAKVRQ